MLDYADFPRCRACPNRGGAHGCTAYGGEGIDPLSAVARCIADRPGDQVAGFPAGLVLIDRGRFQAFVEGRHLLANADGSQPSKEYLAGFKYGALAYRLYLRETGGAAMTPRFGDDPDWAGEQEVRDRIAARTDRVAAEDRRHAVQGALGACWPFL